MSDPLDPPEGVVDDAEDPGVDAFDRDDTATADVPEDEE